MGTFGKILSSWILWFAIFLIIALCALSYLFSGREAELSLTKSVLSKQQTISRAEASNIMSYFRSFGNSVAVLAQLSSIHRRDASTISDMDTFVGQRRKSGIVGGVVLTDKQGIVLFNSNVLGTRDLGQSLADRDYFVWARDRASEGEYFISDPVISLLGASKGQPIVVVASPVYQNDEFTGVVAASVILGPLTQRFLELMKASELEEVYLIDGRGNVLYSNSNPNVIGSNFSEIISEDQTLSETIENALSSNSEGGLQVGSRLIAYSPITLEAQTWLIISSSPAQEVADLATPIYIRQTAVVLVAAFSIILFAAIAIRKSHV